MLLMLSEAIGCIGCAPSDERFLSVQIACIRYIIEMVLCISCECRIVCYLLILMRVEVRYEVGVL